MKKSCRKCASNANLRPLFNFGKQPKTVITFKEFFQKSNILKEDYQKGFKKLTLFFFRTACHLYVTRVYLHVIRMPLVRTRMSFVCHLYALVCHPYVTRMYSYVIRISLVCIRISFVCHSYVILCHPYVTRMYSYASRMYSYVLVCHPYVTRLSSVCHSYVVLP